MDEEQKAYGVAAYSEPTVEQSYNHKTDIAPGRTTKYDSAIFQHDQKIAQLEGIAIELNKKLKKILTPTNPEDVAKDKEQMHEDARLATPNNSPLVLALDEQSDRMQRVINKLEKIIKRIEV